MDPKLIRQLMEEEQDRLDTFKRQTKTVTLCGFQQCHNLHSLLAVKKDIEEYLNGIYKTCEKYTTRIDALRVQAEYLEQLEHDKKIYDEATVHWNEMLKS